ncbi:helix-turn-helix domain-containing protein, partial [Priestia megaterium]|uniref:helix-turn-helix domain-containing protein n=1 Tax=Priestia megaterium TaxID=1404 RepID=UPI0033996923
DIFSLLLNRPNMTIPEMMEALGFNKSTMYRLVSTLEQNGFIVQFTGDYTSAFIFAGILAIKGSVAVGVFVKPIILKKSLNIDVKIDKSIN